MEKNAMTGSRASPATVCSRHSQSFSKKGSMRQKSELAQELSSQDVGERSSSSSW